MKPLVSCVMPTKDRRRFIPAAIDCWRRQTYQKRELIILDDGKDSIRDLVPRDRRIRYLYDPNLKVTMGLKRNLINSMAKGELICHFDDDDWSADNRIEMQVELLWKSKMPVTGFNRMIFWNCVKQEAYFYRAFVAGYVCGTSLCYETDLWKSYQFKDKQVASDHDYVTGILKKIKVCPDYSFLVARIHDGHTSDKAGINNPINKNSIPMRFWENEKLRVA